MYQDVPDELKRELCDKFNFDINNWEQVDFDVDSMDLPSDQKKSACDIFSWLFENYKNWCDNKQLIEADKEEKSMMTLAKKTNLTVKFDANCPLCAICSTEVNAGIFFSNWNRIDVAKYLAKNELLVAFSDDDIIKHRKHIITMPITLVNQVEKIKDSLKTVELTTSQININNIDILQSRINIITTIINELEKNGLSWTEQYLELNKTLMQFIDLKSKITSGEKINVEIKYKTINDIINVEATEVVSLNEIK